MILFKWAKVTKANGRSNHLISIILPFSSLLFADYFAFSTQQGILWLWATSFSFWSLQPRTMGLCSLDQRSGNEWPWKVLIGSLKILDFWLNCACVAFKTWLKELPGVLLPSIFIVWKTNQNNRSYNGTFESRSFRQACVVRSVDSRYEIVEA